MSMKSIVIALACCWAMFSTTDSKAQYTHGVGLAAGFTSAYGLSYRYFPHPIGIQLTFFPYRDKSKDGYNNTETITENYNLGAVLLFDIKTNGSVSFFAYQSNYYRLERNTVTTTIGGITRETITEDKRWNNGLGIGVEAIGSDNITANLMAGYGFYDNFQEINATVEIAFYYVFY